MTTHKIETSEVIHPRMDFSVHNNCKILSILQKPLLCVFIRSIMFPCKPTSMLQKLTRSIGEHGDLVVECQTPEREVQGSNPTTAV